MPLRLALYEFSRVVPANRLVLQRCFAAAAGSSSSGGKISEAAGKGRASAAFSHGISVEAIQHEFENSSSSEEVVAAERDTIDPLSLAKSTIAPSSSSDAELNMSEESVRAVDYEPGVPPGLLASKSRRAMGKGAEDLKGGSRARGGQDQVRDQ